VARELITLLRRGFVGSPVWNVLVRCRRRDVGHFGTLLGRQRNYGNHLTVNRISSYSYNRGGSQEHYFFNHYNVLFSINLHPPSKSNTNSTQILGFILICLSFTTGHFHTHFAKNAAYIIFHFNFWLRFQRLCLLWGLF